MQKSLSLFFFFFKMKNFVQPQLYKQYRLRWDGPSDFIINLSQLDVKGHVYKLYCISVNVQG